VADFLKTFLIGDRFLIHQECKKWHLKVVLTIGYATESHTFLIYFCLVQVYRSVAIFETDLSDRRWISNSQGMQDVASEGGFNH
jgi:hypothetical protein